MQDRHPSIFFDPDWAHPKYYGWTRKDIRSGIHVLLKSVGPLRRALVLTSGRSAEEVGAALRGSGVVDARTEVILHDFDTAAEADRTILGKRFIRARDDQRLLNTATFVIDVTQPEAGLWKNLGPKGRNAVRKATEEGRVVAFADLPGPELGKFFEFYSVIAKRAHLQIPDRGLIERMHRDGAMICASCSTREGEVEAANLIYLCGDFGFYMYGATCAEPGIGVGQLIQWETIKYLREAGRRTYDLGGVSSLDPANGIFRFKKGLGGTFVPLGAEYVFRPAAVVGAHALKRRVRSLLGRG